MKRSRILAMFLVVCFMVSLVQLSFGGSVVSAANVIDITVYGAVADDLSDDTAAINSAIEAANEGDDVLVPNGIYHVSDIIHAKTGVRLFGESQNGAILKFASEAAKERLIQIEGVSHFTVESLTIDGDNTNLLATAIYAFNSKYIKIHKVAIKDIMGGCMSIHFNGARNRGVTQSEISDCHISNIGLDSIGGTGIRLSWYSSDNKILRNTIDGTGRGGILVNDYCDNLIIRHNKISRSGMFDNDNGPGLGIELWNDCNRCVVEDNIIDHWLSLDGSKLCAVRRNIISDPSGGTLRPGIEGACDVENIVFTDNVVENGAAVGISISNEPVKQYLYFGYNTIKNSGLWGAQIQGEKSGCKYMYFYKTDFIDSYASEKSGCDGHGLRLNGNCDYLTFEDCKVVGSERHGVQINPPGVDHIYMENCKIEDNGEKAFVFGDNSPITEYKEYTAFELVNSEVSGNGTNIKVKQKRFDNEKPVAVIDSVDEGIEGQGIKFSSQSYDPDGNIAHVLWDFGDGIPSIDATDTHFYEKPGTYRVTLIVWDDEGRAARAEKTIEIKNSGRYEAEEATLAGGTSINNHHEGYSGNGYVEDFSVNGASAKFDVKVTSEGRYTALLRYANGNLNTSTLSIYVNGMKIKRIEMEPTGDWNTWKDQSEVLILNAVSNSVEYRFGEDDSGNVNLDYLLVKGAGPTPTPTPTPKPTPRPGVLVFEAEDAVLRGGTGPNTSHPGYSGTGFLEGFWSIGASVLYPVQVPVSGEYDVFLRYANGNGDPATMSILVNGVKVKHANLEGLGTWDLWEYTMDTLVLEAGENIIEFKYDEDDFGSMNVDCIAIQSHRTIYEAEDATLAGGTEVDTIPEGYSGTGFVKGFGTAGASVAFSVNVAAQGPYEATLQYSNPDGAQKSLSLYANGSKLKQLAFPAAETSSPWVSVSEMLNLAEGENLIEIRCDQEDTGNVLLDCIYIAVGGEISIIHDPVGIVEPEPSATPMPKGIKYEAEEAVLSNGANGPVVNHIGYSGIGFVDGYWNLNATTSFAVTVPEDRSYDVLLRYCNGNGVSRTLTIYANGEKIVQTVLEATPNWDRWADKIESIPLKAGVNIIEYRFDSEDTGNVNMDYIFVFEEPANQPESEGMTYEAEDALLSGGASGPATNHIAFTGNGFVDGFWNLGASVKYEVEVPESSRYDVALRYANGGGVTQTLTLYVNDVKVKQIQLPATKDWDTWGEGSETLDLKAGINTIEYKYDEGDTGNINLDSIYITKVDETEGPGSQSSAKEKYEFLVSKGIAGGTPGVEFLPDQSITRGDFMVMLMKVLEFENVSGSNFDDVEPSDACYSAVGTAKALGITTGVGNNKFNPKEYITRQDLMTLTARALKAKGILVAEGTAAEISGYSDAAEMSGYAVGAVAALLREEIAQISGDRIVPKGDASMGEAVGIIFAIYGKMHG